MDTFVRVDAQVLASTATDLFQKAGLPPDDARLAVDVLLTASLRGVDTHGVANLLPGYLRELREGTVKADADILIVRETPGTATIDGNQALGLVATPKAMRIAIEKAKQVGIAAVTIGNSRHLAMASYYAMMALANDMIGVCTSASGPYVVPTFAREPRLGTNPIAVAVPCGQKPAYVFDAATSAIPGNRINISYLAGEQLPGGVLADADGRPILESSDPPATYHGLKLLPLGSSRGAGSHKGTGLATIVEILGSMLSGSEMMLRLPHGNAHQFLMVLDIAAFTNINQFKASMDDLVQTMNDTPTAPGHDRVIVAGQLEAEAAADRGANGIPVPVVNVMWFDDECRQAGLPTLSERRAQLHH